jgi:hypothetical protein
MASSGQISKRSVILEFPGACHGHDKEIALRFDLVKE